MNAKLESIEKTKAFLLGLRSQVIGIVTHKNADPDALASAITLGSFLKNVKCKVFNIFPQGLNKASKNVVETLGIEIGLYTVHETRILDQVIDHYILVDTSSPEQLGDIRDYVLSKEYSVIDHHKPGTLLVGAKHYVVTNHSSTSEIIYLVLKDLWHIPSNYATLLLSGILYDTRFLIHVDQDVFRIINELINIFKADYARARRALRKERDLSERIARLKGAKRMTILRAGKYLVAYTNVGAYESSVANSLIELGADAAFVSSTNRYTRVSGRARKEFIEETGLSLGAVLMPELAKILGGEGGGHDTAALLESPRHSTDYILTALHRILHKYLGRIDFLRE